MHTPTEVAHAARTVLSGVMAERLTETERRRVTLLYGLDDGRELSERQVAGLEGNTHHSSVQESRDAALGKLEDDWRLWLLALLMDVQPARFFDCDHCKNDCDYAERADTVFMPESHAA